MGSRRFTGLLVGMFAGLLIWAAHFVLVYGLTGLACARGLGGATLLGVALVPAAIVAATLAALLATGAVWLAAWRGGGPAGEGRDETVRFVRWLTAGFAGLGLMSILWVGLPALQVPVCA
ncbi:hypothetical protein [Azospirillum halopraeferens]|uniref:hypothetical protein n=1 Tax=Azospirillum halopraeferens TaxID=34010 RepID=UPI0004049029|nr:hypothetical protein [Azospirillum halopraeferens]